MDPTKNREQKQTVNLFPAMEEEVLAFWEKNKIFEKSVKNPPAGGAPKGDYVFYDGPPFATGEPHYGHIVASLMKDAVPRYWTMKGYRIERKWGWDCHGLPIENIAEKELGITHKKEIEAMGVEKFNEYCRSKVLAYVDIWNKVIPRLGRWVDMNNPYKTMDLPFMESVWWVFKQLWDKGLVYESYRSMYICPRCETTLSQSEVAEGYKDVKDLSVTVKFELVDETSPQPLPTGQAGSPKTGEGEKTYILAWTTTPWTLIGNVALAVGNEIDYVQIKITNYELQITNNLIIAKERLEKIEDKYEIVKEFKGKDLIGKKYKPVFDYYASQPKSSLSPQESVSWENGWKIYAADFVTTEDGTGVVHIAPAFGEDDMNLGKQYNLPFVQHVGMDGVIKKEATDFAGLHVKPIEDVQATDVKIIKYLADKNVLFAKEKYEHSYPHCWRCETPLINYATTSWFVKIFEIKNKMLKNAKNINWSPEYIKEGRFGNWLEGARDWSISRQRYWASVIPLWKCDCGEMKVVGSVDEIREQFGNPNKLFLIRHGEAEKNIARILSSYPEKEDNPLTKKGKEQIKAAAEELKDKKIDIIISSPLQRAQESAEIIAKEIGVKIIVDEKIRELDYGQLDGSSWDELFKVYSNGLNPGREDKHGIEGEEDIYDRVASFIEEINSKYQGKNIAIISHGDLLRVLRGYLLNNGKEEVFNSTMPDKGEIVISYSKNIDLHKHIVDKITFPCAKCGGTMKRIPDVIDTWFDSGSMPYAQMHYPFENKEKFENNFPAEFIAEGIDQTRCWFYYLHVIASAIEGKEAYKNVIVNGIVLAEDGKKMAKRLKNYPDPTFIFEKYCADAMRYYLLSSPVMLAENLNFSEKGVSDVLRNVNMILWNVYKFYEMYAGDNNQLRITNYELNSENILDKWILARLNQLIAEVTKNMDKYNLPKATRPIADFINDLSTWYIRRSRDRFKGDNLQDKESALATTGFVLLQLSKVIAPFMPFIAEQLWQKVTGNNFKDGNRSVHLESWPKQLTITNYELRIVEEMEKVRKIVELGLAKRDEAGIKIRQPLPELRITNYELRIEDVVLVKDELNVKEVISKKGEGNIEVELDTRISDELKLEGVKRDLVRAINNLRKDAGMTIQDRAVIHWQTDDKMIKEVFEKMKDEILKDTLSTDINEGVDDSVDLQKEVKINEVKVVLGIKKK
jgi:isoleucyl-tRNA synthetase